VQGIGDPIAAQKVSDNAGCKYAEKCAKGYGSKRAQRNERKSAAVTGEIKDFENGDGTERADGVDDDSFPAENGADRTNGPNLAERRGR
jgi:hypothetical protein